MTRRQRLLRHMPDAVVADIADSRSRYWRTWRADAFIELTQRINEAAAREVDEVVGPWAVAPPPGMV